MPTHRPQARPSWAGLLLVLTGLLTCAGCGRAIPPLTHTFESPDALAREVLVRLARNDRAGLEQLALTHDEFEAYVWPHLPASRPERNTPLSFVWGRLKQQSDLSLAGTLARHGGQAYMLREVRFEGETSVYGNVTVRRESVLVVATPDGAIERLKVFGSMLESGGRHKVFSYVTD